ncbi:MAG TPA: hypothetical protein VH298_16080 [Jatrophihabitans sp.]|nr:hypothetical protein [Jatrophihabitans sp.]
MPPEAPRRQSSTGFGFERRRCSSMWITLRLSVGSDRIATMFDTLSGADAELLAWLAGELQPDWMDSAACPGDAVEPAASRLAELLTSAPASRPTAALAEIDARQLSAAAQIDLLELLQQQQNWPAAATARALAAIEAADRSGQISRKNWCRWPYGFRSTPHSTS